MRQLGRFQFRIPSHAAIRAAIFKRDNFACARCGAAAVAPTEYDGRYTLQTNTLTGSGTRDVLVLDHILSIAAGGKPRDIGNLQTLCETCNRRKQVEDKTAASLRSAT